MEMEEAKMELFSNDVRHYPKSNARSRYRKPADSRQMTTRRTAERQKAAASPSGFRERLVLQATICGGFLAVLLFFNIIDTNFTNSVMGWMEHNISYDMLAEEGSARGWVNSVVEFFADEPQEAGGQPGYEAVLEETGPGANSVQTETAPEVVPINTTDSSRVDENILLEIDSTIDVYYESNR